MTLPIQKQESLQTTKGKTQASFPFLPNNKRSKPKPHTILVFREDMRSKYTVAVTEQAPMKLERSYFFSNSQCSFPRVGFGILILSATANSTHMLFG